MAREVICIIVAVGATILTLSLAQHAPMTRAPIMILDSMHYGRSIRTEGFVISDSEAFWEGSTKDECACRMLCWSHPYCVGFSVHPHDRLMHCRVAIVGPHELSLVANSSGSYTFWTDSIVHHVYKTSRDGLLYLVPKAELSFADSKAFCERIPGHRLGIFHSNKQLDILMSLHKETGLQMWVDLRNSPVGPVWGDGARMDVLTAKRVVNKVICSHADHNPLRIRTSVSGTLLDDNLPDNLRNFICQANPYGLQW